MAGRYASNCKISSPIPINVQPDIDLNGLCFSYKVGLMFPPQAAIVMNTIPVVPPSIPSNYPTGTIGIQ